MAMSAPRHKKINPHTGQRMAMNAPSTEDQPPHDKVENFLAPLRASRRTTRQVMVGKVGIGGQNPVRIQSMLTAITWQVDAVIQEMLALAKAGCEIIRLTLPTQRDVDALDEIRRRMREEGLDVPLVADIHFNPRLALACVPWVEKIRINPGNYVDQKRFVQRTYSNDEYHEAMARIEEALVPFIRLVKQHQRAVRVGVNHGSLSDRIMNHYGDTPEGMVESAMEFLRIFRQHGWEQLVLSMKSSNPVVVVQAYRLLALRMQAEGMDYPFHLGVTEAGDGLAGRVKSAVGIGTLLMDGLGDTVRVSLTEPAVNELPAARNLIKQVKNADKGPHWEQHYALPIHFERRSTRLVHLATTTPQQRVAVGQGNPVALFGVDSPLVEPFALPFKNPEASQTKASWLDGVFLPPQDGQNTPIQGGMLTVPQALLRLNQPTPNGSPHPQAGHSVAPPQAWTLCLQAQEIASPALQCLLQQGKQWRGGMLLVVHGFHLLRPLRHLAQVLQSQNLNWPLGAWLPPSYGNNDLLGLSSQVGALAIDGLLDALLVANLPSQHPMAERIQTLLQAARLRSYRTEYISCPSCGRTLFDLQETTQRIQARTQHLSGVKIAVMGCVVNGPGEMADADFGYVGGAPGKVNLYKGQHCMERGVPTENAVERLVALLKQHNVWQEPPR